MGGQNAEHVGAGGGKEQWLGPSHFHIPRCCHTMLYAEVAGDGSAGSKSERCGSDCISNGTEPGAT